MDDQSLSRPFLEGQGRILVPDYDSHSQSSMENCLKPQPQKKRNNSGNSGKQCKKSSKSGKQSQSGKLQTTQQAAVSSNGSQPPSAASTSSYTTARWSSSWNHRSYGCQVAPTGSLLEEVLNEKKMALLKSPDVVDFLQSLQKDVLVMKQEELKQRGDTDGSIISSSTPSKQVAKRSQKRKKSSTRGQADKTPVTSGRSSRQSPGFDLGGQDPEVLLFGRNQDDIFMSDERRAPYKGSSQSDIWSKDASAFSTVTSTYPTNSSQQDVTSESLGSE